MPSKKLTAAQRDALFLVLKTRFAKTPYRHVGITWSQVEARLTSAAPALLWSLNEMERTKGEPDVVAHDPQTGGYVFMDCSPQSPEGRVSLGFPPIKRTRVERELWLVS
ncbi:MAG: DUF4256 domain-containing protein [Opitutaceae bacterium]|jgi:hypothetical protein